MAVTFDPTVGYQGQTNDLGLWDWLTGKKPEDPTGGDTGGAGHKPGDTYNDPFSGGWVTVQPDGSLLPYRAPAAPASDTSAQVDGAGVPYVIKGGKGYKLDGTPYTPVAIAQNPHPGTSYSFGSSVSQSLQDPAVLAETIRSNQAQEARWVQQDALAAQQQDYLKRKDAWAQANDDKRLALETSGQLATVQQQRDNLNFQIQQSQQRSAEAQQALQEHVAEFNATGQQRAAEANLAAADRKATRLQQVNADIGKLGADAGDRGQWASFVTANKGWGADNGALTGANFITDASAQPLESSLANRQSIMAQSDTPFGFTPIPFNPLPNMTAGPLSGSDILAQAQQRGWTPVPGQEGQSNIDRAYAFLKQGGQSAQTGATPQPAPAPVTQPSAGQARVDANDALMANFPGGKIPDALLKAGLTSFEDGGAVVNNDVLIALASIFGMEPKGIAGEKGKANGETVMSNGDVVIVPDKGKLAAGKKKMATGGLALATSPLSMDFLTEASKKARSGTPLEGSNQPVYSPVYASSPGFNPGLASFYNSIRALEQGVPVEYSSWLTNKYRPASMNEQVVGRSQ